MRLGDSAMFSCGNLYTASMPGWLAAGLEDAFATGTQLAGASILAFGYGSGDAAEVMPMKIVDGWEAAAERIGFRRSARRYGRSRPGGLSAVARSPRNRRRSSPRARRSSSIEWVVSNPNAALDDRGIEYYRFVR